MADDRLYAYGIIESDAVEVSTTGVDGATEIRTVDHRRHAAVVSPVDDLEVEETDENARAHDDVLRAVMTGGGGRAVVPMRFGMVFDSAASLKNVLRNSRAELTGAIRKSRGREEVGVKVLAPEDGIANDEAVQQHVEERLEAHAVEVAPGDLFSDHLLSNRSYLVDRDAREAFDDTVDEVREEYDGLRIHYSGPWAPYNFVDFQVAAEG